MRTYIADKIEQIGRDKVCDLFTVDFNFALVDGKCSKQSASPVVDMFIGHYQSERMQLCLCEVDPLVAPVRLRCENLLNVDIVVNI